MNDAPEPDAAPSLLGGLSRLHWSLRSLAVLAGLAILGGAHHIGLREHPDFSIPRGLHAEARIVELFGPPEAEDEKLIGDLLIERYYVVEPSTGRRFVADVCKGRVTQLVENEMPNGLVTYSVVLDRRGLSAGKVRTLVEEQSPADTKASYMGVRIQAGMDDYMAVNYNGRLPREAADFEGPEGQDVYEFLDRYKSHNDMAGRNYVLNVEDNLYLLSSTAVYTYFTTLFRLQEAVFLKELQFVDASEEPVSALME